jgi:hypothetical protein
VGGLGRRFVAGFEGWCPSVRRLYGAFCGGRIGRRGRRSGSWVEGVIGFLGGWFGKLRVVRSRSAWWPDCVEGCALSSGVLVVRSEVVVR